MNVKIRNAVISCHDKAGLKELAAELVKLNPEIKIYASSGTAKAIAEAAKGNVAEVSSYTGFPEMPSGMVKTLHPKIHAGILADISNLQQLQYLKDKGIEAFDLVVVNLYPFEKAVAEGKGFKEMVQSIDVGGVSLIEAAAKNFIRVTAVVNPEDYGYVIEKLKQSNGSSSMETRLELARKAMKCLKDYFVAISNYFETVETSGKK